MKELNDFLSLFKLESRVDFVLLKDKSPLPGVDQFSESCNVGVRLLIGGVSPAREEGRTELIRLE